MASRSRRELERERKILRVREKVGGGLGPEDAERLARLDEELSQPRPADAGLDSQMVTDDVTAPDSADEPVSIAEVSIDELFVDTEAVHRPTGTGSKPIADLTGDPEEENPAQGTDDFTGPRQAIVHLSSGKTRRGTLADVDIDAKAFVLDPSGGADEPAETIEAASLKQIVLMLPKGHKRREREGKPVRLRFSDGKSLAGVTPDYESGRKAFTLIPKADRYIERVVVFKHAVKDLEFDD